MNIQPLHSLILKDKTRQKRDALLMTTKIVRAASAAIGTFAAGRALLCLQDQSYGQALALFAWAYANYEIGVTAHNIKTILENPLKEFEMVLAKKLSIRRFWTLITPGAPVAKAIGLFCIAHLQAKKTASFSPLSKWYDYINS